MSVSNDSPVNVIEIKNVWKSFKNVQAVKGVSLSVPKGKYVALLGSNGAGKTTLVEMIEGIRKPDKGEITIMGKKWKGNEEELHNILGLSLQENFFFEKLTVVETLRLFAGFFGLGMAKVDEIIDLIGLNEKRKSYFINLSGGQKQRLAIGISLINNPTILLLDEPTTGLDPVARREIWNILNKLREKTEISMILTTHYMEEAEFLCDYIVIMDKGQILREGSIQQLLEYDSEEKIIEFTTDAIFDFKNPLKPFPFKIFSDNSQNKWQIVLNNIETDIPIFMSYLKANGITMKSMEFRKKTLYDLFVSLTGRTINE